MLEARGLTKYYSDIPAVRDVSFRIAPGGVLGILGPNGSGKSTTVSIVTGLLEPSGGAVYYNGQDIRNDLLGYKAQIGYVPQSVYLIDDTIRRNIALGIEDGEIDESRIVAAVRASQLENFVGGLPRGLDTVVGERGVKFSGGERQRVAIARALYRSPAVLVFDEATAALDNVTEQALTATIHMLHGDITMIFIAHRLTTVRPCDRLVFLSQGKIAGVGTYDALLESNAEFRRLA